MSVKTMLWTEQQKQEALQPVVLTCECGQEAIVQVDRRTEPRYYYCTACEKFILVETE